MQRFFSGWTTIIVALFVVCPPAAGQENIPAAVNGSRAVVEKFHGALLETMKSAKTSGITKRYRKLEPRIEKSFNLRLMIAIASGRHWKKAGQKQQAQLTQAFKRFSVGTYASRFSSYSGESFETVGVKSGPRKTMLVDTKIHRKNDTPVRITYVVKKFDAAWRIVDIVIDGDISELAVRRSEYAATLKQSGVGALITALNKKADELVRE